MNKTHFLCLLLSCLLVSCVKNEKQPQPISGKTNTISIIIDDQLWYGEVGDTIRNKFASPVLGLTQEEPLFTINQYPAKLLEGFVTDSRSIIVVKKAATDKFEIKHSKALPHHTFRIYGKSIDDIICSIELNSAEMIKMIRDAEIQKIQQDNSKALLNPTVIKNKFHIGLQIPVGYEYMLHKKNFMWLKKEIISGNTSLLIYQIPIPRLTHGSDIVGNIVRMRDSVGRYIKGREPNTQMITGEAYAPYFSNTILNGKKTFETKGTWELRNDFMTGPFINYAIIDKAYNRILVIEGFCYSPSNQERDLMLELEAIIKSVKVDKR
ncbi:endonuclease [Flavobacteriaceae bacterium CRH]|nr:endonuclease [Flavobacteriaceae bacterium CRH]